MAELKETIGTLHLFEGVAAAELEFIAQNSVARHFTAGETIFHEGERADGLWVVDQGTVKVYKLSQDGAEHILHLRGPGDSFNEIAALDGGPNPAGAAALSPEARLWLLPSVAIQVVLERNGAAALHIVRKLAERVRLLVGQIEDLALYSVTVRLARFLLRQAEDPSLRDPGIPRTAVAAHINTTPQTLSSCLRSLEQSGAIRFDRRRVHIVDERILRSIALS